MESVNTHDLPRLTKSAVLERNDDSGLAAQFLQSAAYAGAEAPLRGLAQASDHFTGGHSDAMLQQGFKTMGVEPVKPAEFGTSGWIVQQVGGAVGMMLPFLALRQGLKYGAGAMLGEEALSASLQAGTQSLTQVALREAALSGATGLLYGSFLSPSKDANVGTSAFYADRLKNGLGDAATFAALSMLNPFVAKGMESTAGALETSSFVPALAKAPLSAALRFPLLTGMVSGVPSGMVSAETNALKDGRLLPTMPELKESIGSMSVVGGTLNTATWLLDRAASSAGDRAAEARAQEERAAAAKREGAQRVSDQNSQVLSTPESNRDAILEGMVEQAIKRMALRQKGQSSTETSPEENFLDMMAQSTVKRHGFVSKNIPGDEPAELEPAKAAKSAESDLAKPAAKSAESDLAKPANPALVADSNLPGLEIVLGASGVEAPAHAGFLQAIEDNHVPVGRITGVSGGSLVAALYANKYSPAEIKDILLSDEFRYPKMSVLAKVFHVTDPWNLYPYAMDFRPWLQDFVDTYHLKPQKNLRLIAADSETHAPIIFEGTDIDLTTALAASTAATPALGLKPVDIGGRQAIDGFYYHPIPADLSRAPALVSKIGFVSKFPSEPLAPWDYYMHLKEMAYYDELKGRYPDPPGHIIAETGLPDVATTAFGVSKATLEKLVTHGYEVTNERLQHPDAIKAIEEAKKASQK